MPAHATTRYDYLIGQKVSGPLIDPLTGPAGDICGIVGTVIGVTANRRLALALTNTYRITISLDLAQSGYYPDYPKATATITLPTGSTATMDKNQVMDLMRTLAKARDSIDPAFTLTPADTADVTFPDGATVTLALDQLTAAMDPLRKTYGDLAAQDADRMRQARTDYFTAPDA